MVTSSLMYPISFKVEKENEKNVEKDENEFEKIQYGSDVDNPKFAKFDGIVREEEQEIEEENERESKHRSAREGE